MLQLYTFAVSHFSEKARWALDFEGLTYRDRRLLPGIHIPTVRRIARRTTVPVLVDRGRVTQGSSAILDYLGDVLGATRLRPDAARIRRSAELEAIADRAFGRGIQRIAYDAVLADRALTARLWTHDGPRWALAFYAAFYPLMAIGVRRMYKIDPASTAHAKEQLRDALELFDRELGSGPYLGGDAPSRLDITVAALLAPLCRPPEHLMRWPELPPALQAFTRELEHHVTWQHVLRMYREHRRA